jgi:hypothetical protein
MNDAGNKFFIILFNEACLKCFGHSLQQPLTETESKLLYNNIFEQTGLVIGWKSLKNYSIYILNNNGTKPENPSTATLDTLARYVLNAPYTTEADRKTNESHFPYWFQYKEQLHTNKKIAASQKQNVKPVYFLSGLLAVIVVVFFLFYFTKHTEENFTERFSSVCDDTLHKYGWFVISKDTTYWNRRNEKSNMLSLFTLNGDNWPDSNYKQDIKNLLLRKINADCFTIEVHLQDFFPKKEWQQAGIILMEDTNFKSKSLRLTIAYNDFFGGFAKPKEVIIQSITSPGNGLSQPEEIAHIPVFNLDSANETLVQNNLTYSGLRIEKTNNNIRLLYSCSPEESFAFKEAVTTQFAFHPKYIGLFALKGFVHDTACIPASFSYFSITGEDCKN